MHMFQPLQQAIEKRTAVVGVVGLGYVGLPLVRAFVTAGFRTLGLDVDQRKIDLLREGTSYIGHIRSEWIAACQEQGQFEATADMARLAEPDAICSHGDIADWSEGAVAWFRERLADRRGYALIEDEGTFFAVTDVSARYVAPARYGDRIRVRTWISAVRSRGMTVSYRVSNVATGQLLCKGQTTYVCLGQDNRVMAIPVHWAAKLLS